MRPPLHILHTESSCGWGGQEIRILTEAEGMVRRGHRVTLICPPQARIHDAALARGLTVAALPIARKNLKGLFALAGWLARHGRGVDVINTHSSTDSWLTALAARLIPGAPPLVRTRHVSSPVSDGRATFWLYQRAVRHVAVTGEALRRQLHQENGFALESMTSVPTGIDLARFAPADRRAARAALGLPDVPTLGILATLRNWKGHAYLLDAFAALGTDFPDWRLVCIGDGPQRANLERRVAELGLSDRVAFPGNRDDVPDWLNALDLFVLPSYGDEGVPQSILQAMACGLPVVSTPVGAIAEAVADGETGLLVPARDAQGLAAGLARLMRDPELRARFGAAGQARASERFGQERMLDAMETLFRRHARGAG
ncbi:MAG: glycosyltransferase family 4 protein [Betaproteobacteria bacterium]|nr:glycosyltransferase family 4 protein [Betaproteobacteria bacterium]